MLSKLGTSLVASRGAGLHVELGVHSVVWHSLKACCFSILATILTVLVALRETSFKMNEEHTQIYRDVKSQMTNA
jgi:hypothetical protein